MHVLWSKLRRLQPKLRPLIKRSTEIQIQIKEARQNLLKAQDQLSQDLFNDQAREQVKRWQETVIKLNQQEESMLVQKAKVNWLQLGDSNNAFFLCCDQIKE